MPKPKHRVMHSPELPFDGPPPAPRRPRPPMLLADALRAFREFGRQTRVGVTEAASQPGRKLRVETFVNEFWTARQRQANPLHEISYRACFKPQLPRFFIERLTRPGDRVYDPFMGRGTTLIEAALLGRVPLGCDANPLSRLLVRPRLQPPTLARVEERLNALDLKAGDGLREELLVFYHRDTLRQLTALRQYLRRREDTGALDDVDDWIRLVALNRLTGHSKGFFSVYTLPPNQAVSIPSQRRINERRRQVPPPRDVRSIILKKSRALLAALSPAARRALEQTAPQAQLLTGPADETPGIGAATVDLVVTSPPFLNVVQYATDNWLRCWFVGIDAKAVELTVCSSLQDWQTAMTATFRELARVLKPGGHVAFEVGEIHGGATRLEEYAVPCGVAAGLTPLLVLIHEQAFTKTANCWGVANMAKGTNTNRIVVFRKPSPQWAPSRGYSWE